MGGKMTTQTTTNQTGIDMKKRIIFTEQQQANTITIEEVEQMARDGKYPVLKTGDDDYILIDHNVFTTDSYESTHENLLEALEEWDALGCDTAWTLASTGQQLLYPSDDSDTIWWEDVPIKSYVMVNSIYQDSPQFGLWDIGAGNNLPYVDYGGTSSGFIPFEGNAFKCYLMATPTEE
jgi:hypothetical protein